MSNIHAVKIIYRVAVGGKETTIIAENSDPELAAEEIRKALETLDEK